MPAAKMRIGVVSDTHSLLRPALLNVMRGSDLIVHAGDVGSPEVLEALQAIAPTIAVRGNVDRGELGALPSTAIVDLSQYGQILLHIYMLHIVEDLEIDPAAAGMQAVIYGHSHRPAIAHKNGVLWLNPGSAGPRRFNLPITAAEIWVEGERLQARLLELEE